MGGCKQSSLLEAVVVVVINVVVGVAAGILVAFHKTTKKNINVIANKETKPYNELQEAKKKKNESNDCRRKRQDNIQMNLGQRRPINSKKRKRVKRYIN